MRHGLGARPREEPLDQLGRLRHDYGHCRLISDRAVPVVVSMLARRRVQVNANLAGSSAKQRDSGEPA